ncbi:hypothetical protein PV08_05216 [Exophiala spinifera]|uniref:NmrA-like domain-containing protein n=1 Tax=Exophiala spinifera TaxID=91928 RepID=A0A0D1YJL6_9EURO|nr:uncharacterized protein PV08_05216 [Exophiala spinifera]KIW15171.1 hypothetical protein PV08_05216 [Exophiala spinifera]
MTKTIAVLGATGTQGGSVARTFLTLPGWTVRAITRTPSSAAAQTLASSGAEVFQADLDDPKSLDAAFSGAHAIFAVTDFWQFAQSPKTHELAAKEGITWNEAAYRLEVQHGTNVIDAAARACAGTTRSLERLVFSSLSGAKIASKGKYSWVYHFDSKRRVVDYLADKAADGGGAEQEQYKALLDRTSYVQIGWFLDNWSKNALLLPQKDLETGTTYVFKWIGSPSPQSALPSEHPLPFTHPPTDTGPFVEALVLKAPAKTTMLGVSDVMSYAEFVDRWAKFHGVKAKVEYLSVTDVDEMMPGGFGIEVAQTGAYVAEFGWDGGEGAVMPESVGVDKTKLTGVDEYIRTTDWKVVFAQ